MSVVQSARFVVVSTLRLLHCLAYIHLQVLHHNSCNLQCLEVPNLTHLWDTTLLNKGYPLIVIEGLYQLLCRVLDKVRILNNFNDALLTVTTF